MGGTEETSYPIRNQTQAIDGASRRRGGTSMNEQEIRAAAVSAAAQAFTGRFQSTNLFMAAAEKIAAYIKGESDEQQSRTR